MARKEQLFHAISLECTLMESQLGAVLFVVIWMFAHLQHLLFDLYAPPPLWLIWLQLVVASIFGEYKHRCLRQTNAPRPIATNLDQIDRPLPPLVDSHILLLWFSPMIFATSETG